jgi:hypothetical protein
MSLPSTSRRPPRGRHRQIGRSRTGRATRTVALVSVLAVLLVVAVAGLRAVVHRPADVVAGASAPADEVDAAVAADGVITVRERRTWPPGERSVRLALPPPDALPGAAGSVHPRARDLQVRLDGDRVRVTADADGRGWSVASDGAPRQLTVDYRLTGAVLLTAPSAPGRALGLLAPLTASLPGPPPSLRVAGDHVRTVACVMPAGQPPALCGHREGASWVAVPPPDWLGAVLLQLDLAAG